MNRVLGGIRFGAGLGRTPGVLLVLLAAALGPALGGDQSTLKPASKASSQIAGLWWIMLVGSVVVFAVVLALLLVGVLRRRSGDTGRWSTLGTPFVAIAGVAIPTVTLVVLFALTLATIPATSATGDTSPGSSALVIDVTGRQWFWDVVYPRQHVRTANEIHIPVGEPVSIRATTGDVIHSLWVPSLNRKIDMIPGRTNVIRFQARRAGSFRGQCAEFCGLQHAHMGLWVIAEPPAQFRHWLAAEKRSAPEPATQPEERGQQVFLGSSCVYCHRIAGTNASGTIGPDLTHLASRRALGAATIPNSRGYLAGWILDPQHLKPGIAMPGTAMNGQELQDLLDYLESLR
ncbi:MAG TPA: cytochrome c oxidase subunit II [Gaiellaceae bacterium]|nr:cytochrome c oxidase subunit II [Gaiellaceae bacterium]